MKFKTIVTLQFFSVLLFAATCPSIELWSLPEIDYQENNNTIADNKCHVLKLNAYMAYRCGCYNTTIDAENALKRFKDSFPNAYIIQTRSSYFDGNESDLKRMDNTTLLEYNPLNNVIKKQDTQLPPPLKPFASKTLNFNDFNQSTTPNAYDIQRNALKKALQKELVEFENHMDEALFPKGLNFNGKYGQYVIQNYYQRDFTDYEHEMAINFEFFKDGYLEQRAEDKRRKAYANMLYSQSLALFSQSDYENQILQTESITSQQEAFYYDQMVQLLRLTCNSFSERIKEGTATQLELLNYQQQLKRYETLYQSSTNQTDQSINATLLALLFQLDTATLAHEKILLEQLQKTHPELLADSYRIEALETAGNYLNTLSFNIFGSRRSVDELGHYYMVGVAASIPLDFEASKDRKLATLEQNVLKTEKKLLEAALAAKISRQYKIFYTLQGLIDADKSELEYLEKRLQQLDIIVQNRVPNLDFDPEEERFYMQKNIIDLNHDMALKRIELLRTLIEIAHISQNQIQNIIKSNS